MGAPLSTHSSPAASASSLDGRVGDRGRRVVELGDLRVLWVPRAAYVVGDHRAIDRDVAGVIVGDKEVRAAEGIHLVVREIGGSTGLLG